MYLTKSKDDCLLVRRLSLEIKIMDTERIARASPQGADPPPFKPVTAGRNLNK
jgi:hypothetical protein